MKGPRGLFGKSVKCVRCGAQVLVSKANTSPLNVLNSRPANKPADQEGPAAKPPADASSTRQIGQMLIEDGLLTQTQLDEALAVQIREGGRILQILLSLGYLNKATLHGFLSKQPGMASIDLKSYFIPRDLISLVPKEIAQERLVLPIDKLGRLLTVGMACPLDRETVAHLEYITGLTVKPMLCKLDDILVTIERYYPGDKPIAPPEELQVPEPAPSAALPAPEPAPEISPRSMPASAMPVVPLVEEIKERFVRLDALPTFADTVKRVREAVDQGAGSLRTLADIVGLDPPVVAKLLSVANAIAYGFPGQVTDTNLAVTLLGTDGVCEIAMLSVIVSNQYDTPPLDFTAYARGARFGAAAAKALAESAEPRLRFTAHAVGLLHSIGSLALASAFPKRAAELDGARSSLARIEAETRLFGMGYPEAGALLAVEWGIPRAIAESIRVHRDVKAAAAAGPLEAIAALAAVLTDCYAQSISDPADALDGAKSLLSALHLSVGQVHAVYEQAVLISGAY